MTCDDWIRISTLKLSDAGILTARLDSLVLLANKLNKDKAWILANPNFVLSEIIINNLKKNIARRSKSEPLAYIIGSKEFYGRTFIVSPDVLIPRPESESFITLLKKHRINQETIIDVGCGSGVLGISAKLELPNNSVILTDIDSKALKISKTNAQKLLANCKVIKSNLIPEHINPTVVMANLPYVPKNLTIKPDLCYEPPTALFANNKGMEFYIQLWKRIAKHKTIRYVVTESLKFQHNKMINLAIKTNYKLIDTEELVQIFEKN